MIIIGYQGIGKSTLARKSKGFIDLESSSFYVNGKRPTDWHYYYNRIAEKLMHDGIKTILIDDMRYDLENLIRWVISVNLEIDFHDRQIWEDVTETAAMMEG
jgi:ABC-type antimicrobial peptide transport system ATPase subunit